LSGCIIKVFISGVAVSDGTGSVILAPTQLGSAVVASALSPDEGLAVFSELLKARRCFVLENELHTVYLVSRKNTV
jgi:DNA polymerase theta